MRTLAVLAILSLPLAAADLINTPKLVSDNNGGVCYIQQPYQGRNPEPIAPTVVHRYANRLEEVYSNPEGSSTLIGNTIACTPEYVYFTVKTNGVPVVNKLYRQYFGVGPAIAVVDPQATTGLTSTRFIATLDLQTKGNRVIAVVLDSQGEVYAIELANKNSKNSVVADLGGFSSFGGTCATGSSLFALLNVGNLTQLMELTPKSVKTKLAITTNGDGALACNNFDAYVAYHNGDDLVVETSNGNKTVYANTPGKMNGFAIADNGYAMAVMKDSGNKVYILTGGKASTTSSDPLSLAGLPTTVVESNGQFTIGSYSPRR